MEGYGLRFSQPISVVEVAWNTGLMLLVEIFIFMDNEKRILELSQTLTRDLANHPWRITRREYDSADHRWESNF